MIPFEQAILPARERLQKAVELELATLPPYITAFCSIHPGTNREAAEIIHSVFMEEMLHLVLAGNTLSAIGGTVRLGADNIPTYPLMLEFQGKPFQGREFEISLARFSPQTIEIFKQIEQPDGWEQAPDAKALRATSMDIEGDSIGAFYKGIQDLLLRLSSDYGEAAVFCGDPARQISQQYYWYGGGKPLVVDSLQTAHGALETIIEQGEGAYGGIGDGDHVNFHQAPEVAHFFRFNEIAAGRRYVAGDAPTDPPSGAPVPVDYEAVYPIIANPTPGSYAEGTELFYLNQQFSRAYAMMLSQIEEAMGGEPRVMYTAIKNGMHQLSRLSRAMMARPIPGDPEGRHGAPSFSWIQPNL